MGPTAAGRLDGAAWTGVEWRSLLVSLEFRMSRFQAPVSVIRNRRADLSARAMPRIPGDGTLAASTLLLSLQGLCQPDQAGWMDDARGRRTAMAQHAPATTTPPYFCAAGPASVVSGRRQAISSD